MIRSLLNWRSLLALLAIVIVSGTIFYSQYLAKKIAAEERQKVALWVAASNAILNNPGMDLTLPNLIRNGQQSIPIIETNEQDSITGYINLDTTQTSTDKNFVYRMLKKFRSENQPWKSSLAIPPLQPTGIIMATPSCWMKSGTIPLYNYVSSPYSFFLPFTPLLSAIKPLQTNFGQEWPKRPLTSWALPYPPSRVG